MDKKLIRYYKKQMYGGRSIAARAIDFVMFRFMVFFMLFLALFFFSRSLKTALLISVFLTMALSLTLELVKRKRILRFIKKDTVRIKQKCLLEALTMLSAAEYKQYMGTLLGEITDVQLTEDGFAGKRKGSVVYVFHNHPSSICGIDSVIKIIRAYHGHPIVIVSLSDFDNASKSFCSGNDIKLVTGKQVLEMAAAKDMLPDEQAAEEKARKEMNDTVITLDKIKESAFNRSKVKAYIFCGLIVMCWPFVMGFKIYYPIIAMICFVMAAVTFRKNKVHEESHDIGIS